MANIDNPASNQGAQGVFYGDVYIYNGPAPGSTAPAPGQQAAAPEERTADVELFSKPPTATSTTAIKPHRVDWSGSFAQDGGPTIERVWESKVEPDLARLRAELGQHNVQRMRLFPRLHSGLGFGVGAMFVHAMPLSVEQANRDLGVQMWSSNARVGTMPALDIDREKLNASASDVLVELSFSRNIGPGIDRWLATEGGLPLRRRVCITPPGGPSRESVPDEAHAVAFAKAVGKALCDERDQAPGAMIHVFAALPVALEVLIGLRLNACEPIQCYGYSNATGSYYPFYRLGSA